MRRLGWVFVIACGSKEQAPPSPAPPPAIVGVVADAATPGDAIEEVPRVDADTWSRDACAGPDIGGGDRERTLLWSCLGIALDVPAGLTVRSGDSDMDGLVTMIEDADPDRLAARFVGTRLDAGPRDSLVGPPRVYELDGEPLPPIGPPRHTGSSEQRTYSSGSLSAVYHLRVLDDQVHQLRIVVHSAKLSARALEAAAAPLFKIRVMTASERAELGKHGLAPVDWAARVVDRVLPMVSDRAGPATHELVLCKDGTYAVTPSPLNELPQRGRYRIAVGSLAITSPSWHAEALDEDDTLGYQIGPFGTTAGTGPFAPAGARCK